MNNIKLYLLGFFALFITGCTNQNSLSTGTIQEEKTIQFKENEYIEILTQKDIEGNNENEATNRLKLLLQDSIKRVTFFRNDTFAEEKLISNYWFEISNNNIIIESNIRNIMKNKRDISNESIDLGGSYGNRMFKVVLPYKITKVNDKTFRITVYNSENIKFVESINNITNKPYIESSNLISFKDKIITICKYL